MIAGQALLASPASASEYVAPAAEAKILWFQAMPADIQPGLLRTVTIAWASVETTRCAIEGIGEVATAGSARIPTPAVTTTYLLTCDTEAGQLQRQATVTVNQNQPPHVNLHPMTPADMTDVSSLQLVADAQDTDGAVAKVEFYADGQKIAERTAPPYDARWTPPGPGHYLISAVATDNAQATSRSEPAMIAVGERATMATAGQPFVRLTLPGGSFNLFEPATFTLSASVTPAPAQVGLPSAPIKNVEFFATSQTTGAGLLAGQRTKLGEVGTPNGPNKTYTIALANWPAGTFECVAVATDERGAQGTGTLTVTIKPTNRKPPTVTLRQSGSTFNLVDPATFTLSASIMVTGSIPGQPPATVVLVEFFESGIKLGEVASPNGPNKTYTLNLTNWPAGTYSFTAKATDALGSVGTSTALAVTIKPAELKPPIVRLVVTGGSFNLIEPATFTLSASVTPVFSAPGRPAPAIKTVAFLAGMETGTNGLLAGQVIKVGEVATPNGPNNTYTLSLTHWPAGSYTMQAVAVDERGAIGTGTLVVTIKPPMLRPPSVMLRLAGNSFNLTEPANLTLNATVTSAIAGAGQSAAKIVLVEFFESGIKVGESTQAGGGNNIYTLALTNWPAGTYSFTAKGTDERRQTGTSAALPVTIRPGPAPKPGAKPPFIWISLSPARPMAPATVTMSANATPASGQQPPPTLTRIEYFVQDAAGTHLTKIGEATSSPYKATWSGVPEGTYRLVGKARDSNGGVGTSTPVTLTVTPFAPKPPTVTLRQTGNFNLIEPASFGLAATVTPAMSIPGQATKILLVEFFEGGIKLGEAAEPSTNNSYTLALANWPAGTYSLVAKAKDALGSVGTSRALTVTIKPANRQPPTVRLALTGNSFNLTEPADITFSASVTQAPAPSGQSAAKIKVVEFFATSHVTAGAFVAGQPTKLGEAAQPTGANNAYTLAVTNWPAGVYDCSAVATDEAGSRGTGALTVTVKALALKTPTVTLRQTGGSSLTEPASFSVSASVISAPAPSGEPVAKIAKVEFVESGVKLGEVTQPNGANGTYTLALTNWPAGSYSFIAKATDERRQVGSSTPLTVTIKSGTNPTPGAVTVSITSPANGARFTPPATIPITATATPSVTSARITKMEFFQGTTKLGEAATSPGTFTWSNVAAGTYSLTAKATDSAGATGTSTAVSITVGNPSSGQGPTVAITSPANGATFTAPAVIDIIASASSATSTIGKVEFFEGSRYLGVAIGEPYQVRWMNVSPGTYTLTAKATDGQNRSTTSAPITVIVRAGTPGKPPTVTITSPTNGATFTAPATVDLAATATSEASTIAKVEFFNGTTKLGSATTSPYTAQWTNVTAGTYFLIAKATDAAGRVGTSTAVRIVVNPPSTGTNHPPVLAAVASRTVPVGQAMSVTLSATDPDAGDQSQLRFSVSPQLVGLTLDAATGAVSWTPVASQLGPHPLTFRVTDPGGLFAEQTATFTVDAGQPAQPPTVSLIRPAGGATFMEPATIELEASAASVGSTIAKVEFFNGTTKLGQADVPPYIAVWVAAVSPGQYTLTAKATDAQGQSTASAPVTIEVRIGPNIQPLHIALLSPVNGATFAAPASIALIADARPATPGPALSKVEFFDGANKIGEVAAATGGPVYTSTWANPPAGTHTITAKVTDAANATATSSTATITIAAASAAPVLVITAPAEASTGNGPAVTVTYQVTGDRTKADHVHFQLDQQAEVRDLDFDGTYVFVTIANGPHVLKGYLASANHERIGDERVVHFTVATGSAQPPTVSITSPANGASVTAPASIHLEADAKPAAGGAAIANVEFFNGTTKLGESTGPHYHFDWTAVPAGSYTLTAKVTDAAGLIGSSAPVTITVKPTEPAPAPPQMIFLAIPTKIDAGRESTLVWLSLQTESCEASGGWQGAQPTSGSESVRPTATTTYTLTCKNAQGATVARIVTVTVNESAASPRILLFLGLPRSIRAGQSSTLFWAAEAASCELAGGDVAETVSLTGAHSVAPTQTTTYRLSCQGGGQRVTRDVTVTVRGAPAKILFFEATQRTIPRGESTLLLWAADGAQSCRLSDGAESRKVEASGTLRVAPVATTMYVLGCGSADHPDTKQLTIEVQS